MISPLTCSIIIPTWNASKYIERLIRSLSKQTKLPERIVVVDSSSVDDTAEIARRCGANVMVIPKNEFNHGGTRNRAAVGINSDILVFMTQDALPVNESFLSELISVFDDERVLGAYARQLPYEGASRSECFARNFNYPQLSQFRSCSDIQKLGVRAYFFSNVASAVRRSAFVELGGFPERVPMNEDMVICSKILHSGGVIAYCAQACVYHSHDYTLRQQAGRYFDVGAFFFEQGALLPSAKSGGEGLRFAVGQIRYLVASGCFIEMLKSIVELAVKWLSFKIGFRHRFLPVWLKRKWSMHHFYW